MTTGERIRVARIAAGLTQRELADRAGPAVTYSYVSRVEADGRRPSLKALTALAAVLGVPVPWLAEGRVVAVLELGHDALGQLRVGAYAGELDRAAQAQLDAIAAAELAADGLGLARCGVRITS